MGLNKGCIYTARLDAQFQFVDYIQIFYFFIDDPLTSSFKKSDAYLISAITLYTL